MSRYERHASGQESRVSALIGPTGDEVDSNLIAQRKHEIRAHRSGKCVLARKRLKAMFYTRKYYRAIMGLTGLEAVFVFVRLILEAESLRFPPGNTQTALVNTQLALFCVSLFILFLFVVEQPFKWWALGSRHFCRSVMCMLDAIVCMVCFSLNIYNIHKNATRPTTELASARQLSLCGATHITNPPDTAWTFALSSGMIIVFRLWCISGYINKSILKATKETNVKLATVQQARESAETRAARLETVIREQAKSSARNLGRNSGASNSNSRSNSKRSGQDSRASRSPPDSGEQI
ncbi:hypothetical protein EG68_03369 [Paragonimus skrjabini miyazakii]|uniref:Voltage-gated hydrogen channel 1 n=1 Tax=Paragonimus skrjabini miyazakii TaxID=59628 RepID=A0A8S9YWE0_9TREM|nr:hypothetical protein EG68_03369 [Paragonimus skrjabini miyazakii]